MKIPRGTVEDQVDPGVYVVAPQGSHLATVLYDPAFQTGRIKQCVNAAVHQLIDGKNKILGLQGGSELIQPGSMAPVVIEKDLRLGASQTGLGIRARRARRAQHSCRSCRTHGL